MQYEYARSALKNGLALDQKLGANPYDFGMIGSTDSHTSLATGDEDNFFGKMTSAEPAAGRGQADYFPVENDSGIRATCSSGSPWPPVTPRCGQGRIPGRPCSTPCNARKSYATTGPRIAVRFFGGWNFQPGDEARPDFAYHGYREGVPMGGELSGAAGKAPSFLVAVARDPLGANLDRVQIVKGLGGHPGTDT